MPAYIVSQISVTTVSGNVIWFCVIETATGNEYCRCVSIANADKIALLLNADAAAP